MNFTDQPGRILAVFVISPILLWKGLQYKDWFIILFAVVLFGWDLYWLLMKEPCKKALSKAEAESEPLKAQI
jgi:hypothetical protein